MTKRSQTSSTSFYMVWLLRSKHAKGWVVMWYPICWSMLYPLRHEVSALLVLHCVNTKGLPTHLDIDYNIHDATIKMPLLCYKRVHSFHSLLVSGSESTTTLDTQWLLHIFMTSSRPDHSAPFVMVTCSTWSHEAHALSSWFNAIWEQLHLHTAQIVLQSSDAICRDQHCILQLWNSSYVNHFRNLCTIWYTGMNTYKQLQPLTQNITNATYTIDLLLPQEDVSVDSSVDFNVLMLEEKICTYNVNFKWTQYNFSSFSCSIWVHGPRISGTPCILES